MNEIEREITKEKFLIEYNNRVRIFEDSQRICQETINFDVFLRRADEILSFIEWSYKMKDLKILKATYENKIDAISEFDSFFNHHCLRIAKCIKGANKVEELKLIDKSLRPASNFREVAEYIANEIKKNELE